MEGHDNLDPDDCIDEKVGANLGYVENIVPPKFTTLVTDELVVPSTIKPIVNIDFPTPNLSMYLLIM